MAKFIFATKASSFMSKMKFSISLGNNANQEKENLKENLEDIIEKKDIPIHQILTEANEENNNLRILWKLTNPNNLLSNSPTIRKEKNFLKFLHTINAIISILVIILTLIENELEYYPKFFKNRNLIEEGAELEKNDRLILKESYNGMIYRIIESCLCFISVLIVIIVNYKTYRLKYDQRTIVSDKFLKSTYFPWMIIEILIAAVHPFPFYDYYFTFESMGTILAYRIQVFFYAFTFLKIYPILNLLTIYSKYSTFETEKLCEEAGMELDTVFVLKAFQKDHPFTILTITLILVALVFGTILRYFELLNGIDGNIQYRFYSNGIWNIVVAITTVGYGDFFPKSHIGRAIVILALILGTVIISLTVVALNGIISFDEQETNAYFILNRVNFRKLLDDTCQKIIYYNFKINKLKKSTDARDLNNKKEYAYLVRCLQDEMVKRLELSRKLNKFSTNTDKERFMEMESVMTQSLIDIKKNLEFLREIRRKIKSQIKNQANLTQNIQNSLKLTRDYVKPLLQKLIVKYNPGLIDMDMLKRFSEIDDSDIPKIGKGGLKYVAIKEMENNLFDVNEKLINYYFSDEFINEKKAEFTLSQELLFDQINTGLLSKEQVIDTILKKVRSNLPEFYVEEDSNKNKIYQPKPFKLKKIKPIIMPKVELFDKKKYHEYIAQQNKIINSKSTLFNILLVRKVGLYTNFLYNEKYNPNLDKNIFEKNEIEDIPLDYLEKNPVFEEYEKITQLNQDTRKFLESTSEKSMILFSRLARIKKNEMFFDDIKENDRIDIINKEDIFDSVCEFYDNNEEILEIEDENKENDINIKINLESENNSKKEEAEEKLKTLTKKSYYFEDTKLFNFQKKKKNADESNSSSSKTQINNIITSSNPSLKQQKPIILHTQDKNSRKNLTENETSVKSLIEIKKNAQTRPIDNEDEYNSNRNLLNKNQNKEFDPIDRYNKYVKSVYDDEFKKKNIEKKKGDHAENFKNKIAFLESISTKTKKSNENKNFINASNKNYKEEKDLKKFEKKNNIPIDPTNKGYTTKKGENSSKLHKNYNVINKENQDKFRNFESILNENDTLKEEESQSKLRKTIIDSFLKSRKNENYFDSYNSKDRNIEEKSLNIIKDNKYGDQTNIDYSSGNYESNISGNLLRKKK